MPKRLTYHPIAVWRLFRINKLIKNVRGLSTIRLNVGCGNDFKAGYINCDQFGDNVDVILAIRELPFRDNSADLLEMHHALEHVPTSMVISILEECKRVLKPSGYFILSVPDLESCFKLFLRSSYKTQFSTIIQMIYGSQEHEGMFHKTGFTNERLENLLNDIGFEILFLVDSVKIRPTPSLLCVSQKR
jgi:predicted SAM-dependent methyltransferase